MLIQEIDLLLEAMPHPARFDEYNLISWQKEKPPAYYFNDSEEFDVMEVINGWGNFKASIDKNQLTEAVGKICCAVYHCIHEPTDTIFALHTSPDVLPALACTHQIHHAVIQDWLGVLEEYDICLMKMEAQALPIETIWKKCRYFFNPTRQLILQISGRGFSLYASDESIFEKVKQTIAPIVAPYKALWGEPKPRT